MVLAGVQLVAWVLLGCRGPEPDRPVRDAGKSDTDTDAEADTDADVDTVVDADPVLWAEVEVDIGGDGTIDGTAAEYGDRVEPSRLLQRTFDGAAPSALAQVAPFKAMFPTTFLARSSLYMGLSWGAPDGTSDASENFGYDAQGRLVEYMAGDAYMEPIWGATGSWSYGADGLESCTNFGMVVELAWGADGHLAELYFDARGDGYTTDGMPWHARTSTYEWDDAGALLAVSTTWHQYDDPPVEYTFVYDADGRLVRRDEAQDGILLSRTIWTYDAANGTVPTGWALPEPSSACVSASPAFVTPVILEDHTRTMLLADGTVKSWVREEYDLAGRLTYSAVSPLTGDPQTETTWTWDDAAGRPVARTDVDHETGDSAEVVWGLGHTRAAHDGRLHVERFHGGPRVFAMDVRRPGSVIDPHGPAAIDRSIVATRGSPGESAHAERPPTVPQRGIHPAPRLDAPC
jgi:hypothetical protein